MTYKKSAEFRDGDTQAPAGIYDHVYFSDRPELFFKGTEARCTGPNDFIGIRKDSRFTAVEPELGVLLSSKRKILGFLVSNDVSAWDIERENPLFLPQSKIYTGCCSLGPVLLTADEVPDPYALSIRCEIKRGNQVIFSGDTRLSMMKRTIQELIDWLFYANPIPMAPCCLPVRELFRPKRRLCRRETPSKLPFGNRHAHQRSPNRVLRKG